MPDWRRLAVRDALRGRPYRVAAVALALAAAVWCVRLTITTVRQERRFVGVWMAVHQPPPGGIDIRGIVNTLETMRAETGDARGEIAMWIVSILRMYLGRRPDMPADLRQQVEQWRERYYRQALADAPDNRTTCLRRTPANQGLGVACFRECSDSRFRSAGGGDARCSSPERICRPRRGNG